MKNRSIVLVFCIFFSFITTISAFSLLEPPDPGQYGMSPDNAPPFYKFCGTARYYHINSTEYNNYTSQVSNAFSSWNSTSDINFSSSSSGVEIGTYEEVETNPGQANVSLDNYKIFDNNSFIQLNTHHTWYKDGTHNINQYKFDVETILLHEIGHLYGLAHPNTSDYTQDASAPIMAGGHNQYFRVNIARTLRSDDVNGVTWLDEHAMVPEHYSSINSALNSFSSVGEVFISFQRGYTLQANISLASGETLTITNNGKLNLGTNKITLNGGTVNIESGSINPKIIRKSGSIVKGYYPSIASAINDASSGETIEVYDTYTLSNDITIPSGVTLKFASGEGLVINGKITANGTSSTPIIFTSISGTWDGISLSNATSACEFNYCEIKNATRGILVDNTTSVTIDGCYIHHNQSLHGIDICNGSSVRLFNCTIKNNYPCGVYVDNYSDLITGNGLYSSQFYGYNDIYDNYHNLGANNNSDITAGMGGLYAGIYGRNRIYSTSCHASAYNSSDIYIQYNDWDDETHVVNTDATSNIYDTPEDNNFTGGGSPLAKSSGIEYVFDPEHVDKNDPESLYSLAKYYKLTEEYEKAVDVATDIINRFPVSKYTIKALAHIICKTSFSNQLYLKNLRNNKNQTEVQKAIYDLSILDYLRKNNEKEVENLCLQVIKDYENSTSELLALYTMFNLSLKTNKALALKYIEIMKDKYSKEHLTLLAMDKMGEPIKWTETKNISKETQNNEFNEQIIKEFSLHPAYPNPFNPTTTIPFTLSKQSKVDIRIYNLKGKEVWSWGDNLEYGVGSHKVIWNAIDATGNQLSTGVYFIKLIAGEQVATNKVIFMK